MENGANRTGMGKIEILRRKIEMMLKESQDPYFTQYLRQTADRLHVQEGALDSLNEDLDKNFSLYSQKMQAMRFPQPVEGMQPKPLPPPACLPVSRPVLQEQKKSSGRTEFMIATGILSVIGILFILAAFVMLGITFMSGLVKGLCLYLIAAVLILVSELFLNKRLEKISGGITGLGICSLYAATIINYQYLKNFNGIAAIAITLAVAAGAVFLSRKRDSGIVKVISFWGCYLCLFPIGGLEDSIQLLTVTVILFAVNLMTIVLPVKKSEKMVHMIHMVCNTAFTAILAVAAFKSNIDIRAILIFILSNVLLLGFIFFKLEKMVWKKQAEGVEGSQEENIVIYATMLFIDLMLFVLYVLELSTFKVDGLGLQNYNVWQYIMLGLFGVVQLLIFLLFLKSRLKWISYYALHILLFVTLVIFSEDVQAGALTMLVLFAVSKVLSKISALKVSEIVITSVTVCYCFLLCVEYDMGILPIWYLAAYAGVFLASILVLHKYKTFYQSAVTIVLLLITVTCLQDTRQLTPAVIVAILFLLLLLFNNVKRWRGTYIKVYNYGNLALMLCWYVNAVFYQDYISYTILTLLGISIFVLAFQKKYYMDFKYKYLYLAVFLTYMTLIFRIGIPALTSGIMMLIAAGSVIAGFALKRKTIRLYGLVLSLAVCVKIMLFDFIGIATVERMLLFFVTGVVILAISCIYAVLEKRTAKQGDNIWTEKK